MLSDSGAWLQEHELAERTGDINANWSRCEPLGFTGVDELPIHAVRAPALADVATARPIMLLPGRTEPVVKYRELCFELNRLGHAVYLIDHRGQGLSGRMLDDRERGHVVDFEHYVDDAETFLDLLLSEVRSDKPLLFGHSMGGCIGARLLQRRSPDFAAAVLFSPMLEIAIEPLPGWVARVLSAILDHLPFGLARPEAYLPGGGGLEDMAFEDNGKVNPLTRSVARFERRMRDYEEFPAARLGSPTRQWLAQALKAMRAAIAEADRITCPTLVFSAGDDPIVCLGGQQMFCKGGSAIEGPRLVPHARHELLIERDAVRNVVLEQALAFAQRASEP